MLFQEKRLGFSVDPDQVDQNERTTMSEFDLCVDSDPMSAGPNAEDTHLNSVPSQSFHLDPTSPSGTPARERTHRCQHPGCDKAYDRASRADDCSNKHLGITPYQCTGRCGKTDWYVISSDHIRQLSSNLSCSVKQFRTKNQLRSHEKVPCVGW
jgi:hypothetical protein